MEIPTFPLRLLPENARVNVLKLMEIPEIIAYSLNSMSAKKLVKSLGIKVQKISLFVQDYIRLEICFLNNDTAVYVSFYRDEGLRWEQGDPSIKVRLPEVLNIKYGTLVNGNLGEEGTEIRCWRHPQLGRKRFGSYIRHFLSVFSHYRFEFKFDNRSQRFATKNIKRELKRRTSAAEPVFAVTEDCSNEYHHHIHNTFKPMERLEIEKNPYEDSRIQRLLIQNFNELRLKGTDPFTLDDLLICNSVAIQIIIPATLSIKDINRYLKLWMAGKTLRRPAYISYVWVGGDVTTPENILKGIHHHVKDQNTERNFPKFGTSFVVKGGYDFHSRDGHLATIITELEDEVRHIVIYFW